MSDTTPEARLVSGRRRFLQNLARGSLGALVASVFGGTITGCRGDRGATQPGNRIVIGLEEPLETLDPAMHSSRTVEAVVRNISDGLVTRDNDMNLVPEIAERLAPIDECSWKCDLRKGVTFHDGSPLTADDVKFTIERIVTPKAISGRSSPRKGLLGEVSGVEVPSDYECRILTAEPFPVLDKMLAFQEMVPKHYVESVGPERFAREPMGCGPFRFVEWSEGERVVLRRYDGYYGGSPAMPPIGPAQLEEVVFRNVPEVVSRISALLAGEVHLIEKVPPHQVSEIEGSGIAKVATCNGTRTYFIGLNCARGPFADKQVRHALKHAVDTRAIVDKVLHGQAAVLPGILIPQAFAYHDGLRVPAHDPEQSRQLLKASGVALPLEVELDCKETDKDVAEVVASQLAAVGVQARVRLWKWDLLLTELQANRREMFLVDWGNASLDPVGILTPLFRTKDRGNFTGFSDPQVDEFLNRSQTTLSQDERRGFFVRVQEILDVERPFLLCFTKKEIYGVSKLVQNWRPRPDSMLHMHDVSLRA